MSGKGPASLEEASAKKVREVSRNIVLTAEERQMVEENANLVGLFFRKHFGYLKGRPSAEDVLQEGFIGLCTAAHKFDPSRGVKFRTHAFHWIRAAMQKEVDTKGGDRPNSLAQLGRDLEKAATFLMARRSNGERPNDEELARFFEEIRWNGVPGNHPLKRRLGIDSVRERTRAVMSLDQPLSTGNDGDSNIKRIDTLTDGSPKPGEAYEREEFIRKILEETEPDTRKVLIAYFGLNGEEGQTQEAIAEELGVTHQAVSWRIRSFRAEIRRRLLD